MSPQFEQTRWHSPCKIRKSRTSASAIENVKRLLPQGNSIAKVVAASGVGTGTVRKIRKEYTIPASRPRVPPVSDETKQKIKELLLDGSLSMHKVAQMCNVSMCTVSRVQFVNGLPCSRAIYDNAVLQRVRDELTKGTTLKKVAETCNVTLRFVRQVKLRYGLNDAYPSGKPFTSENIDQIKACLLGGLSHAETKELCGVSRGAPSIIRKKYKIDYPCAIKYVSVAKQKKMKKIPNARRVPWELVRDFKKTGGNLNSQLSKKNRAPDP